LYGAYANRTRGARARRGPGAALAAPDRETIALTPSQRQRRRQWARLIAKVFEVDPLRCPCGGTMRVVAFILDRAVRWVSRAAADDAVAATPRIILTGPTCPT
jgi:hypothetical protein